MLALDISTKQWGISQSPCSFNKDLTTSTSSWSLSSTRTCQKNRYYMREAIFERTFRWTIQTVLLSSWNSAPCIVGGVMSRVSWQVVHHQTTSWWESTCQAVNTYYIPMDEVPWLQVRSATEIGKSIFGEQQALDASLDPVTCNGIEQSRRRAQNKARQQTPIYGSTNKYQNGWAPRWFTFVVAPATECDNNIWRKPLNVQKPRNTKPLIGFGQNECLFSNISPPRLGLSLMGKNLSFHNRKDRRSCYLLSSPGNMDSEWNLQQWRTWVKLMSTDKKASTTVTGY